MNIRILLVLIISMSLNLSPASALWGIFEDRQDKTEVELVLRQAPKSPLRIVKHNMKDYGVSNLHVKTVAQTFMFKVKNVSEQNIISYKIGMKEYHPFQEIDSKEFVISSVKKLKPNKTNKSYEQRIINENIDTLFIATVDEVLFEDGTVWNAEEGIIKP
ncbi:MAG: hypothetical protein HRT47_04090 [Candidatus Caenarcaniphilales bacterium]|nr:hypothetical protein [Candidatus Caenarcaniphilales bacterium]